MLIPELKKQGVGIAGAQDYKVDSDNFICHYCHKEHECPAVAKAVPMRFWCSKECFENERTND